MPKTARTFRDEITELEQIPNIGPSIAANLRRIGVRHPADLQDQDPFAMYDLLCRVDARPHDLCVLDVFMAAVDFMQGGRTQPWWKYTPRRKREMAARSLTHVRATTA